MGARQQADPTRSGDRVGSRPSMRSLVRRARGRSFVQHAGRAFRSAPSARSRSGRKRRMYGPAPFRRADGVGDGLLTASIAPAGIAEGISSST